MYSLKDRENTVVIVCKLLFQIYADRNLITELAANTFSDLANLTKINLTGNRLDKFPLNALALQLGESYNHRCLHFTH